MCFELDSSKASSEIKNSWAGGSSSFDIVVLGRNLISQKVVNLQA